MNIDDQIEYVQGQIDRLDEERIESLNNEDYDYADFISVKIEAKVTEMDALIEQRDM